jgi:UDP-N-acetylglucosamine diphosphorylase/glucosamine-1-phosphate N-acetyltransferase
MQERWETFLLGPVSILTEDYMQPVFPLVDAPDNFYINGGVFATTALADAIQKLEAGQVLKKGDMVLATRLGSNTLGIAEFHAHIATLPTVEFSGEVAELKNVWDTFSLNDKAIREDFQLVVHGRKSAPIPEGVTVSGQENLFIEEGANIYPGCIINASTGPVYIGRHAEILEGTLVRGPLAVCEHGVIKMGAKVYGATTIGPGCKVGGELNNVVFFANSNKAHDGFLGNAVIGEWCNLGADTNCSNLKNNYDGVDVWDEAANKSVNTGLTFCGLMMGDHSKCAINTMFNTGTVVAVSCNIFGSGFPGKFIPSFSWGSNEKIISYDFRKAMDTADRMMARRNKKLSEAETNMYRYIFDNHSKAAKAKS